MNTRAISQTYTKLQAATVIASLVQNSCWFDVTPYPDNNYRVTIKDEGRPLPIPTADDQGPTRTAVFKCPLCGHEYDIEDSHTSEHGLICTWCRPE